MTPTIKTTKRVRPAACPASAIAAAILLVTQQVAVAQVSQAQSPERQAQVTSPPASVLETIDVKGGAIREDATPFTVNQVDQETIRDASVRTPEALLNRIPGVSVNNYNLGGVANVISMRGFGDGAHGGGIGVMIDGIPLNEAMSHADGYADFNVLIPLELESFTVFKGPVSALYGNFNRAGLIDYRSRKGGTYAETDFSLGSFGTADVQAAYGARLGPGQFNGAAQLYRSDGFRPDSRYMRGTVTGRYAIPVNDRLEIAVSGRAHEGEWDSAAYLTREQFFADPYGKDPRVQNDGGRKSFYTGRVDANYTFSESLKLLTFVYGTQQSFDRRFTRPVSAASWSQRDEIYDRDVVGLGFNFNGRNALLGKRLNWVAGFESYAEGTDYDRIEGLTAGSRVGAATTTDRKYQFDSNALFGEAEWVVSPLFRPTLGIRYDRFSGNCNRRGAETTTDPCGRMPDFNSVSPKLGVRSTVAEGVDLRASYSEGFVLPDGPAKFATGTSVKPNELRQVDAGVSLRPLRNVRADLGFYRLLSSNEIRTVSPGVYENFGETRRSGFEGAVSWLPGLWELTLAVATANSSVRSNANAALVGKRVVGVPERTATAIVAYRPESGWGGFGAIRHVGDYAVDAVNTTFGESFQTVDLGVTYAGGGRSSGYRLYARLDNAFDKRYAANQFLIAGQRLYSTGMPRMVSVGAQLTF